MLSTWRDIAVFLDASPSGEKIGRHAAALAKQHKAHLVGIYGVSRQSPQNHSEGFARGEAAIRQVLQRRREDEERKVLAAGHRFAELTSDYDISSEFRIVWRDRTDDDSVLRALHCDLIVAAHPRPHDLPANWSAERLLLTTGTPVLLIPEGWTGESLGNHLLIAWNRSREARRAVNDAMPFILEAARTTILIIDSDHEHFGDNPGSNLLEHLKRHDANAEVANIASDGTPVAEIIAREAARRGADLLVFGAYSRPRTTELLFGGTTRSLLAAASLPMFISR